MNIIKKIRVRDATAIDSMELWQWRNDQITRQNSINTNMVEFADHCNWFANVLTNPNRKIMIGFNHDKQNVGMVRFDLNEERTLAVVSINVNPDHRGRGISVYLLDAALKQIQKEHTLVFHAEIRHDNIASIKCFTRCGFTREDTTETSYIYKNRLGIIDAIEQVRVRNNVNWMDLLRLAFTSAPQKAREIVRSINTDDTKISELLKQLGEE
ncbi:hypothetical protein CL614_08500 [archaeon]|nr:hypothetical protein [archaeon]|tara:strand:- start:6572 stop:7207 length:636 start_codon:yes stop_codon:yes gene_type:complete